ncbi:alpha-amylase family protein [Zhihengliuella alba]|uniref:Alpha-amylase n=1 Tax=Zhihengliuella alba TaxID=547018 RepID=A0ABP7DZH6_9MICC
MKGTDSSDLWWKTGLVYCVDVESFLDSNGDGVGDLAGLTRRIDYLAELGVTCLWLMPFYPTPGRDDGYDITDFYNVDPRLGSLGDLVALLRTAHDRGIRVIADLVLNHTSDQHPWFQRAEEDPDSPEHDFYVWRDSEPPDTSDLVIFHGEQKGIWSWSEKAGKWYLHRFYKHQPDLNVSNRRVRNEIAKIMGFWLQLGLDGFRVDAVPQLLTVGLHDDIENDGFTDPHGYLGELHAFMRRRSTDAILLGEVNLPYREQETLFGEPPAVELDLIFDFVAMQNLYLSLARGEAGPISAALRTRPPIDPANQWVTFVRNHDELALDQLGEAEREEVFAAFAPEERQRAYGRGIRRRLPPMLEGDQQRIRMVYSFMFSLPGTPALFYGEEIGMGEDIDAEGRQAVRSPMQWAPGPAGGFSEAEPEDLVAPVVGGDFGPENINAHDAAADSQSLFNFIRRLVAARRRCLALGWGSTELLEQPETAVLAHRAALEANDFVAAVHNFAAEPVETRVLIPDAAPGDELEVLVDVGTTDDDSKEPIDEGEHAHRIRKLTVEDDRRVPVALGPYGFLWFRPFSLGPGGIF